MRTRAGLWPPPSQQPRGAEVARRPLRRGRDGPGDHPTRRHPPLRWTRSDPFPAEGSARGRRTRSPSFRPRLAAAPEGPGPRRRHVGRVLTFPPRAGSAAAKAHAHLRFRAPAPPPHQAPPRRPVAKAALRRRANASLYVRRGGDGGPRLPSCRARGRVPGRCPAAPQPGRCPPPPPCPPRSRLRPGAVRRRSRRRRRRSSR